MNNAQSPRRVSEIDPASGPIHHKSLRAIECVLVFLVLPIAHRLGWLPIPVILMLLIMAVGCWLVLRIQGGISLRDIMHRSAPISERRRILVTYAIAFPLLTLGLWLAKPDALFGLIRQQPMLWLLVMLVYPLVSVFPQELAYRVFFFNRYRLLFGQRQWMIAASAVGFSLGHIVFQNWPSVLLTFLGGWLFARTYQRTESVVLVAIEHTLYGWAIFTIGYGEFFLAGTMRLFQS